MAVLIEITGDYVYKTYEGTNECYIDEYRGSSSEVTTPSSVTFSDDGNEYDVVAIGEGAYASNTNIESVTITSNIKTIGAGSFKFCTNLKEIIIENGVETIGSLAFADTIIKHIDIPNSVTKIGRAVFYDCDELLELVLPDSITEIYKC